MRCINSGLFRCLQAFTGFFVFAQRGDLLTSTAEANATDQTQQSQMASYPWHTRCSDSSQLPYVNSTQPFSKKASNPPDITFHDSFLNKIFLEKPVQNFPRIGQRGEQSLSTAALQRVFDAQFCEVS